VSGFRWSAGEWVEVDAITVCISGVHACAAGQLAYWLHDELWEVELDGRISPAPDSMVAQRGRLVRRIDAWSDGGALRFAQACHDRLAAKLASSPEAARFSDYLGDAARHIGRGVPAMTAYIAALIASRIETPDDEWTGYRRERAWQSDWIVRNLAA
jgi:hypothetical protein